MAISGDALERAVLAIAAVDGVSMDASVLVEDVALLARAYPAEDDFMAACVNTCKALENLVAGKVDSSPLKYGFEEWRSYHYQHRVGQGTRASCRILFRAAVGGGIEVKGFGHRRIPRDFYARMAESRNSGR